ncbi:MAG: hypothetical protein U0793_19860 [Gemmataceae bacterium]
MRPCPARGRRHDHRPCQGVRRRFHRRSSLADRHRGLARAWWDANITGKDEDFKRKEEAQNKIDAFLSAKDVFAATKAALKESKEVDDPMRRRRRDLPHAAEKQVDSRAAQAR